MTNWYHYYQPLNHNFGCDYNEKIGLSAEIYVEADNADEADDLILSISNIGFVKKWIDDETWMPASRWNRVDESDVPTRDEIHFPAKKELLDRIAKDDEFEAFVHPKNDEFYGVWK